MPCCGCKSPVNLRLIATLLVMIPFHAATGYGDQPPARRVLVESLERRLFQNTEAFSSSEYDSAIEAVLSAKANDAETEKILALILLSLALDTDERRHHIGAGLATRCDEVLANPTAVSASRKLAVLLKVVRFDAPEIGEGLESTFWTRTAAASDKCREACLMALPLVSWSHANSSAMREKHLASWFADATSEQMRLSIIGAVSGAVVRHKCDPVVGVEIYSSIVETGKVSQEHMQAMLGQIREWIGDMQLRDMFKGQKDEESTSEHLFNAVEPGKSDDRGGDGGAGGPGGSGDESR